jgi:HlyD family secretion protein
LVKLILSEKNKILVIPKGSFNQETAGKWLFVVNGNKVRRKYKIRQRKSILL